MKVLYPLALVALLTTAAKATDEQLLLVVEVSRHGARETSNIYNFTKNPNQNFNGTGNLLPFGKWQHWQLGQHLKQKYIDEKKFLSSQYDEKEVLVQTTFKERTYLSSLYQLMGMYPDNHPSKEDYDKYDIGTEAYLSKNQKKGNLNFSAPTFDVEKFDSDSDLLLHVDKDNCPRYAKAQDLTKKSAQYAKVSNYFVKNYKSSLEKLTNTSISSAKEMIDICGYIQWAELANLDLKFKPKATDDNYCLAFGDSKLYSVSYGIDELWKLGSYEFLNKLIDYSDSISHKVPNQPKFIHYAAHAETLAVFFDGLQIHRPVRSFPSSALIIEFANNTKTGALTTKLIYYDGETRTEQILRIPTQNQDSLTLNAFTKHVESRISQSNFTNVETQCAKADLSVNDDQFYSGQLVLNDLTSIYGLPKIKKPHYFLKNE